MGRERELREPDGSHERSWNYSRKLRERTPLLRNLDVRRPAKIVDGAFLERTWIVSGIQFTTHFIDFFVGETKQFVGSSLRLDLNPSKKKSTRF